MRRTRSRVVRPEKTGAGIEFLAVARSDPSNSGCSSNDHAGGYSVASVERCGADSGAESESHTDLGIAGRSTTDFANTDVVDERFTGRRDFGIGNDHEQRC
jgi:hypothetical protein